MSERVLVSAAEIARLAGVERAAVSNWRRRHTDFPVPVAGSPGKPLFALAEVEEWLRSRGKLHAIPAADRLWQEIRSYGDDRRLIDLLADVAALLCFRTLDDDAWQELVALPDEVFAVRLPEAVREFVVRERIPGGAPFTSALRPDQAPLWRSVVELADDPDTGDLLEDLHGRYLDSSARTVSVTSLDLATVIASMVPPVIDGVILDPACGSGTLLQALSKKVGTGSTLSGQEVDPSLARVAWYRLHWRGVGGETIRQGDSLRDDKFADSADVRSGADVVVCDPPTGEKNWGHDELGYDPRWEFGLPPRAEPELAWLQHCYAHLRPGAIAVVIMPVAVASRRSGRRVRAEMLRRGALREVIALPPGLAGSHALGLHLWVLIRPSAGHVDDAGEITGNVAPATSVRMIDGSRFDRERLRRIEGDWWHQFKDESGITAKVPVIELLDDEVDLTPSRYVQRSESDLPAAHEAALAELAKLFKTLPRQTPARMSVAEESADWPMVSIAELVRADAVHVVLNRDLLRTQVDLEPGDILVPVLNSMELPTVVRKGSSFGEGRPTPDLHLLRCDAAVLDPYFVAGFLRSEANLRQAVTSTGTFRYDVRRAMIPRLPLAEQRRYAAEFWRLAEFAERLHRAAELGEDVVRLAHDGLSSGVFIPSDDPYPRGK